MTISDPQTAGRDTVDARDLIVELQTEVAAWKEAYDEEHDKLAALSVLQQENERLKARASKLEDAAFHFQTCATCKRVGDDACVSGRQFSAFLRGETDGD